MESVTGIYKVPFLCVSSLTMACPFLDAVLDEEALILRRASRHERVFRERSDPLAYSDDYLHEKYRFSADGKRYLCRLLGSKIQHCTAWSHALTIPRMICVALPFIYVPMVNFLIKKKILLIFKAKCTTFGLLCENES